MARIFFKSKSLTKYPLPRERTSVVRTRLRCTDHNSRATSWAARESARPRPCMVASTCRAGKTAVVVTCRGMDAIEDFKDSFFGRLDRLRRQGRVQMSGRRRR